MARKLHFVGVGLSKSIEKPCKPIPLMFDFVNVMAEHVDDQGIPVSSLLWTLPTCMCGNRRRQQIAEQITKDPRKGQCPATSHGQFRVTLKNRPRESIEDLLERSISSASHAGTEAVLRTLYGKRNREFSSGVR
ncbi:MAG TPA: hypothetical protein VI455_10375 [Terriglobia bacterium]